MYSHFDTDRWVTPFGLIFVGAMITVWMLARRNALGANIDGSHVDLLFPIAVIVGITGGTIVAIFMPMDHRLAGEMMNHGIRIRLFGMLATAAIAVFIYSRLCKLLLLLLLGALVLLLMLSCCCPPCNGASTSTAATLAAS